MKTSSIGICTALIVAIAYVWNNHLLELKTIAFWTVFTVDALFDNNRVSFLDSIKTYLSQSLENELLSMPLPDTMAVDEYYMSDLNDPSNSLDFSNLIKSYRAQGKPLVIRNYVSPDQPSTAMSTWSQDNWIERFSNDPSEYLFGWRYHRPQFRGKVGNFSLSKGLELQKLDSKWQFITDDLFRNYPELLNEANLDILHSMGKTDFDCQFVASIIFWSHFNSNNSNITAQTTETTQQTVESAGTTTRSGRLNELKSRYPATRRLKDLHCDGTDDFYLMISGRKVWYIAESQYSKFLRPWIQSSLVIRSLQQIGISSQYIPHHMIELNAGDLLYLPAYIWHSVLTLSDLNGMNSGDSGDSGESIGIANRCMHRNRLMESPNAVIEYLAEALYMNEIHKLEQYSNDYTMTSTEYWIDKMPVSDLFIARFLKPLDFEQQNATMKLDDPFCVKKRKRAGYCYSTSQEVARAFNKDYDNYEYYP